MVELKVGRNDPCPCGSGRKFKACCLGLDEPGLARVVDLRFGGLAPEEFAALDPDVYEQACELDREGTRLLQVGGYAEARSNFLRAIELCPTLSFWRNNLALADLLLGNLEAAARTCDHVVGEIDDTNAFAHCLLAQVAWMTGDHEQLEARLHELALLEPADPSALTKMLETFGRVGRHEEILALVDEHVSLVDAEGRFFAGVAAANLDDMSRAGRELSRAANSRGPLADRARVLGKLIRRRRQPDTVGARWPYTTRAGEVLPPAVWEQSMEQIRAAVAQHGLDESRDALAEEHMPGCADALVACLRVQIVDGDPDDAAQVLQIASFIGNAAAAEMLREIATGSFGTDNLRLGAMHRLQRLGVITPGERLPMFVRGAWTTVQAQVIELDEGAVPERLPLADERLLARAAKLMDKGDLDEAETVMRDLMTRHSSHPVVRQSLGAVLGRAGREDEAFDIQCETVQLAPDYLPGRTTLLLALATSGQHEAAEQMMRDYDLPERTHPEYLAGYRAAQAMVALHGEPPDVAAAEDALDAARALAPEHPTVVLVGEVLQAVQLSRRS